MKGRLQSLYTGMHIYTYIYIVATGPVCPTSTILTVCLTLTLAYTDMHGLVGRPNHQVCLLNGHSAAALRSVNLSD